MLSCQCPNCDFSVQYPEAVAERVHWCMKCGKPFVLPELVKPVEVFNADIIAPSMTKICPYCAEKIQAAAIKCRYCNSLLSGDFPAPPHRNASVATRPVIATSHFLSAPNPAVPKPQFSPESPIHSIATDKVVVALPAHVGIACLGFVIGLIVGVGGFYISAQVDKPGYAIGGLFLGFVIWAAAMARSLTCSFCKANINTTMYKGAVVCKRCKTRHIIHWDGEPGDHDDFADDD